MKKNKKIIILSIIVLIGITFILTSYGFFNTKIFGNDTSKLSTFKNNPLSIVYSDSTNVISGDASDTFTPGSTITKTFSVTNPGTSAFSFGIVLDDITNTFTRVEDITYTVSLDGNTLITDTFPTSKKTIIYNQNIEPNETLNYVLTINYLNSEENQIEDSGAEIGAKLIFDYGHGFDNLLIYGNSIQNGTPSPSTPVEIQSVGDLVTDSQDEHYGEYKIPVKVKSKNVIDASKAHKPLTTGTSGYSTGAWNNSLVLKYLKPNTQYTMSYEVEILSLPDNLTSVTNSRIGFILYKGGVTSIPLYTTGQTSVGTIRKFQGTFTTPSDLTDHVIYLYTMQCATESGTKYATVRFSNIQIEEGNKATEYEPYVEPITSNIYLDEPLRKIGNADAVKLPDDYKQLEYIQSTGTQYIDTGYIGKTGTSAEIEFVMNGRIANEGVHILSSYTDATIPNRVYLAGVTADNSIFAGQGALFFSETNVISLGTKYKIETSLLSNAVNSKLNGVDIINESGNYNINGGVSLYLFSRHLTSPYARDNFIGKIYYCKIYDNGTLVRNFIPAKNSSGIIGMYDTVTNTFYTNAGTGTFTAGPQIFADYIDLKRRKVIRNVGEVILNGSETWSKTNNAFQTVSETTPNIGNRIIGGVSSHFTHKYYASAITTDIQNGEFGWNGAKLLTIRNDIASTAEDFKTWLSTNNTTIDYILETPVEENIKVPNLSVYDKKWNVSIGTSIEPSNVEVNTN